MFQAARTVHDIDADSAIGTCSSIITDDRSSCRFSNDEEVSKCVYHIINGTIAKMQTFVESSKYICTTVKGRGRDTLTKSSVLYICRTLRAFICLRK